MSRRGYRPSSQPALPQTPDARVHLDRTQNAHTRSPSPFLLEHRLIEENDTKSTMVGDSSYNYLSNVQGWHGSVPWESISTDRASATTQGFTLESSASFFDTQYGTDPFRATPASVPFPTYGSYGTFTRPHTPASQASGSVSSYDGVSGM